jgi:hypothetical protein
MPHPSPNAEPRDEASRAREPISPELVLVDPELAVLARAELPEFPWLRPPAERSQLQPDTEVAPLRLVPPTRAPRERFRTRRLLSAIALVAAFGLGLALADRTSLGDTSRDRVGAGAVARPRPIRPATEGRAAARPDRPAERQPGKASGVLSTTARAPASTRSSTTAKRPSVRAPLATTARVTRTWARTAKASYYDFRLFRGRDRILDLWPATNNVLVPARWTYGGVRYRLTRGRYAWYVYPGFGQQRQLRLGPLRARGTIVIR